MKTELFAVACCLLFTAVSCQQKKTPVERDFENYAPICLTPSEEELSTYSGNGKEVINLYRFAASIVDSIYWDQYLGRDAADALFALPDGAEKDYAVLNYGPWDRISGKAFLEGFGDRPSGANFYPADMTDDEFQAMEDTLKDSPYTLIRRNSDGQLEAVWFHDAYAEQLGRIENCLRAAAAITIKPSVRDYLLKKIDALQTDDYYVSDKAWLNLSDSKMDFIIGPNECTDDERFGIKDSYEAMVILKDLDRTEELREKIASFGDLQQMLPTKEEYKASFKPGSWDNIYVGNAVYYAGRANAGIKVIAVNLPFSPRLQAEKGTKTILMYNLLQAKYNKIVSPAASVLLDVDQRGYVDDESFLWNIVFREVSHGLGVKETINGKGTVMEALGNEAETIEEVKASVLGAWLACQFHKAHELSLLTSSENGLITYLTNLVRSSRFGNEEHIGRSNIIIYNYLKEKGGFSLEPSNYYVADYEKMESAMAELCGKVLEIQATGDYDGAKELIDTYSVIGEDLLAAFSTLRMEKIPIDLRFID